MSLNVGYSYECIKLRFVQSFATTLGLIQRFLSLACIFNRRFGPMWSLMVQMYVSFELCYFSVSKKCNGCDYAGHPGHNKISKTWFSTQIDAICYKFCKNLAFLAPNEPPWWITRCTWKCIWIHHTISRHTNVTIYVGEVTFAGEILYLSALAYLIGMFPKITKFEDNH